MLRQRIRRAWQVRPEAYVWFGCSGSRPRLIIRPQPRALGGAVRELPRRRNRAVAGGLRCLAVLGLGLGWHLSASLWVRALQLLVGVRVVSPRGISPAPTQVCLPAPVDGDGRAALRLVHHAFRVMGSLGGSGHLPHPTAFTHTSDLLGLLPSGRGWGWLRPTTDLVLRPELGRVSRLPRAWGLASTSPVGLLVRRMHRATVALPTVRPGASRGHRVGAAPRPAFAARRLRARR